jgi:hypothetical protein
MSEVKVNKITPRTDCGTTQIGDSGDTITVTGDLRSDSLKAADGGVIISQSGTTITVGASGDTVSLASGASQSGFGRSGTVDWQTSSIKTSTFTAVSGQGFFADTSSGAFTMNLPAGTAGAIVSVADYTNTFQTNNLTIAPNGSQKIGGIASSLNLSTEGQSVTFVYVDDTEGWKNVQDSTSNVTGNPNLIASGGTETTSGNYKIHTFTGPGTFTVCKVSETAADNTVSYLVVAGGGGSAGTGSMANPTAGAGAGGFREFKGPVDCYSASPLNGNPGGTSITVTAQAYPITVGGGGSAGPSSDPKRGTPGVNSTFSTVTSHGGGTGGHDSQRVADAGGSGGGTGGGSPVPCSSAGNTPPVSPPQGQPGGNSPGGPPDAGSGGGGGATAAGGAGGNPSSGGGAGGNGATTSISGSPVAYAGGGGGGANGSAGSGGGGVGGATANPAGGGSGTANRGGGAGGRGPGNPGNGTPGGGTTGGSGIVIIRYKFQ